MRTKQIIKRIKLIIRLLRNKFKDILNGYTYSIPSKDSSSINYQNKIQLSQRLNPNDAKVHNLKIAIKSIEATQILPGEIFSFWKIVGNPSIKNGFIESRSIIGNQITKSIGGGLCQLSGLIYYIGLISNLEILERYNHSMDIYNEKTRFTPLGSDATVVYGYKDLKIRNNHSSPINFTFILNKDSITIELNHNLKISRNDVKFEQIELTSKEITIQTIINGKKIIKSRYKKPVPNIAASVNGLW